VRNNFNFFKQVNLGAPIKRFKFAIVVHIIFSPKFKNNPPLFWTLPLLSHDDLEWGRYHDPKAVLFSKQPEGNTEVPNFDITLK